VDGSFPGLVKKCWSIVPDWFKEALSSSSRTRRPDDDRPLYTHLLQSDFLLLFFSSTLPFPILQSLSFAIHSRVSLNGKVKQGGSELSSSLLEA